MLIKNLNRMKNQIEIVKDIADGMIGIGGIPSKLISYNKRINTTISRYNPTLTSIKTDNDGSTKMRFTH